MGIDLPLFARGKVRDVYDMGDKLLMVTTDRISAFDHVLPTLIPDKGKVLNQISVFWFKKLENIVPNDLVAWKVNDFPPALKKYRNELEGRTMLVNKTQKILFECVVRGYLAGSGWKEYKESQTVCGIKLPASLRESEQLPEPIFTPATKEEGGKHDVNVSYEYMAHIVGERLASQLRDLSLGIFKEASKHADSKGFILADTKFEFGILDNKTILIDEALTPDSSRFWEKEKYAAGRPQEAFDKQFVRDYLEKIQWNKQPPAPALPSDIIEKTRQKYIEAYERLTGEKFRG
jgi:phosphoribosylaminoimidazole-succinocarboxamide synthase